MHIAGYLMQSFSDFPGVPCAVLFTPGCTFRCGYCHNPGIIDPAHAEKHDEKVLMERLSQAKWALEGVVITGGEPTLQNDLPLFCSQLKEIGYKVKLDTNGTNPAMVKKLMAERLVDYVAMDMKAPYEKYPLITGNDLTHHVKETAGMILHGRLDHEFRTTFCPDVLTDGDVHSIVQQISGAKRYALQQFRPTRCLDKRYESFRKPTPEEIRDLAKRLVFRGEIRIRTEQGEEVLRRAVSSQ